MRIHSLRWISRCTDSQRELAALHSRQNAQNAAMLVVLEVTCQSGIRENRWNAIPVAGFPRHHSFQEGSSPSNITSARESPLSFNG